MKKFPQSICVLLTIMLGDVASEAITCEKTGDTEKTCFLNRTSTIDSEDFVISPADPSVLALIFEINKQTTHLPIRTGETFPNLVVYYAGWCSITAVAKKNFKDLHTLKELHLHYNRIERISYNTLEDLKSLEILGLVGNIIKEMNGAAFVGLNRLNTVDLSGNDCINKDYAGATAIARLAGEVGERCGFEEKIVKSLLTPDQLAIEKALKVNIELLAENTALKANLNVAEAAKSQQQARENTLGTKVATLEKALKASENARTSDHARESTLAAEIAALNKTLNVAEEAKSQQQAREKNLGSKVATLEKALKAAEDEKTNYQNQISIVAELNAKLTAQLKAKETEGSSELGGTVEKKLKEEIGKLLDEQAKARAGDEEKEMQMIILGNRLNYCTATLNTKILQ